jgi:hypothetical protein
MSRSSLLYYLLGSVDALVMFALAIAGDEMADLLEITPVSLIAVTCVLLLIQTVLRPKPPVGRPGVEDPSGSESLMPPGLIKFPVGMLIGLIGGTLIPILLDFLPNGAKQEYEYYASAVLLLFGGFSGLIIGLFVAVSVDGCSAGILIIGYGLAYPAAALLTGPKFYGLSSFLAFYFGCIILLVIIGLLIIVADPFWHRIRKTMTRVKADPDQ